MAEPTHRPWSIEQSSDPLGEAVFDAQHNQVNLYKHLDLIVAAVNERQDYTKKMDKQLRQYNEVVRALRVARRAAGEHDG